MLRHSNNWLKIICTLVTGIVLATVLMIIVYSIPREEMYRHAKQSQDIYVSGVSNWAGTIDSAGIDTFTESIMVNTALSSPYESVIENAMKNPTFISNSLTANEPQGNLKALLDGGEGFYGPYARYWHGYLLYLKPLLLFFNMFEIRMLMMMFQISLLIFTEILLYRENYVLAIAFVPVVLFINPVTTILSLQYADIMCITMLALDYILLNNNAKCDEYFYVQAFLIIGMLTSFIDFFTYPIVSLCIPLILVLVLSKYNFKKSFDITIRYSVSWTLGYFGMWFGKWMISDILVDNNTVADALYAIVNRTDLGGISYISVISAIMRTTINKSLYVLLIMGFIIIVLILLCCRKTRMRTSIASTVMILFVGIYPLIWYFVVRNHACVHPWIEYRELAATIWALFVAPLTIDIMLLK